MALVLCTGDDRTLLKTRRLILERDGHKVITATNQQEVTDACKHHKFAVAVIGQRLPLQSKQQIFDVIRQNCKAAKILELYSPLAAKHANRQTPGLPYRQMYRKNSLNESARLPEAKALHKKPKRALKHTD